MSNLIVRFLRNTIYKDKNTKKVNVDIVGNGTIVLKKDALNATIKNLDKQKLDLAVTNSQKNKPQMT